MIGVDATWLEAARDVGVVAAAVGVIAAALAVRDPLAAHALQPGRGAGVDVADGARPGLRELGGGVGLAGEDVHDRVGRVHGVAGPWLRKSCPGDVFRRRGGQAHFCAD